MSNLYGYGRPSGPDDAGDAAGRHRHQGPRPCADVDSTPLAAHEAGRVRVTEARAADFFGPQVPAEQSHLGRQLPALRKGRRAWVIGDPDAPRTWGYLPDVAATLATLGTDERALGRAWHVPSAPPRSQRQALDDLAAAMSVPAGAGDRHRVAGAAAVGLVVPMMREVVAMRHQFDQEFVIDARRRPRPSGSPRRPWDEVVTGDGRGGAGDRLRNRGGRRLITVAAWSLPGSWSPWRRWRRSGAPTAPTGSPAGRRGPAMTGPTELPVPDTADVRSGPGGLRGACSRCCRSWASGTARGRPPAPRGDHRFGQWIRFSHDGRGFLAYESRTWRLTDDGEIVGPDVRESGFWRPRGQDDVELLVASPEGLVEIYVGTARTTTSWELTTDVLARTPDAPAVTRAVRLYGIVDGALMYAIDRARPDEPLRPRMSARLERIR